MSNKPASITSEGLLREVNSSIQCDQFQAFNGESINCSMSINQPVEVKPVMTPNISSTTWNDQQIYLAATLSDGHPNKQTKLQQHLFTLLHTYQCMKLNEYCAFPKCKSGIRELLDHISSCLAIESCPFNFCTASKKLLTHWNNCLNNSCEICFPLRKYFSNLISWRSQSQIDGSSVQSLFKIIPHPLCFSEQVTDLVTVGMSTVQMAPRKPLQQLNAIQMMTQEDVNQYNKKLRWIQQSQQNHAIQSNTSLGSAPAVPVEDSNSLIYTQDEMKRVLLATLNKMLTKTPEVIPFRKAVGLKYADYYEIIKKPMDLSKIQKKLLEDAYSDPWGYIEDVNLMLSNAQLYNKKNSNIFTKSYKISDTFEREITIAMKSLGFCCGEQLNLDHKVLYCSGKRNGNCQIARNDNYFIYELLTEKPSVFLYCEQCFYELKDGDVSLILPDSTEILVEKLFFRLKTNNVVTPEPFIDCCECTRKFHVVCVRYLSGLWPKGFICDGCLTRRGAKRRTDRFSAHKLPKTTLSEHIETHVNNRLMQMEAGANPVIIRVLSNVTKNIDVKPETLSRLREQETPLAPNFQYQSKGIFAFQKIDGVEILIFGMFVQEYGSDCQPPNAGRVYLEFLDTVNFFRPRKYRTIVYEDIILSYLDFVTKAGYQWAHVFTRSFEGRPDYIFNCHPADQKFPKSRRLQDWYKKLLNKGIQQKVIVNFRNLFDQTIKEKITTVARLPYFANEYWPKVYEEVALQMKIESEIDDQNCQVVENGSMKRKNFFQMTSPKRKKGELHAASDFDARIFDLISKNKDSFFVIQLESQKMELPIITDTVALGSVGDFTSSREDFFWKCRDENLEFTSIRHAQFTSMSLLFDLHNFEVFHCNLCKATIQLRYHCTVCEDYDLCFDCYIITSHPHHMNRLESKMLASNVVTPDETQKYMIGFLIHSYNCKNHDCSLKTCKAWKLTMLHYRYCPVKAQGGCSECQKFQLLCCNHAKDCLDKSCIVPFCLQIKNKIAKKIQEELLQNSPVFNFDIPSTTNCASISPTKVSGTQNLKLENSSLVRPELLEALPAQKTSAQFGEQRLIGNNNASAPLNLSLVEADNAKQANLGPVLKYIQKVWSSDLPLEEQKKIVKCVLSKHPKLCAYVIQKRKIRDEAKLRLSKQALDATNNMVDVAGPTK